MSLHYQIIGKGINKIIRTIAPLMGTVTLESIDRIVASEFPNTRRDKFAIKLTNKEEVVIGLSENLKGIDFNNI